MSCQEMPRVVALDWCNPEQRALHGTFDFVIAADCVYHPTLAGVFAMLDVLV